MNKKAEMGIGTLIIFISLVFVAAIAANVLIQTSMSLQSKALETAKSAKGSVSTRLEFTSITTTDGSDGLIGNFTVEGRLAPGSDPIDLTKLSLSLDLTNRSGTYNYSNEACSRVDDSSGDGYYVNSVTNQGTFTIQYIQSSNDHVDGYLARGELVKICFESPRTISEDEELTIRVTPRKGFPTVKKIILPSVMVYKSIKLFP